MFNRDNLMSLHDQNKVMSLHGQNKVMSLHVQNKVISFKRICHYKNINEDKKDTRTYYSQDLGYLD